MKKDKISYEDLKNKEKELAESLRNIENYCSKVGENSKDIKNMFEEASSAFSNYLKLLEEFSFSDDLTQSSTVFPGIRTIRQTVDLEKVAAQKSDMINLAQEYKSKKILLNNNLTNIISLCKKIIKVAADFVIEEEELDSMKKSLINETNSVYDIGDILN